jgi:hypothetical protein
VQALTVFALWLEWRFWWLDDIMSGHILSEPAPPGKCQDKPSCSFPIHNPVTFVNERMKVLAPLTKLLTNVSGI